MVSLAWCSGGGTASKDTWLQASCGAARGEWASGKAAESLLAGITRLWHGSRDKRSRPGATYEDGLSVGLSSRTVMVAPSPKAYQRQACTCSRVSGWMNPSTTKMTGRASCRAWFTYAAKSGSHVSMKVWAARAMDSS
ncbi:MAG: hypothetical protein JOZ57_04000, partial [Abitibacteriaceae bacterium]|nr:hypothetical protein [Abditibacteriaceae bacterium]